MTLMVQIQWLFILALPVACVAWTVTHEEILSEPRHYCETRSNEGKNMLVRKFFYLFTCEYCFSHYVTIFFVLMADFKLLLDDWRGYLIAGFALVWMANIYMSLFGLLRQNIKREKKNIKLIEEQCSVMQHDESNVAIL